MRGLKRYFGVWQRPAAEKIAAALPAYSLLAAPISQSTFAGGLVEFKSPGHHLSVLSAPWSDYRRLTIHFDDPSNDGFPCRPGVRFDHPFEKFFLLVNPMPSSVGFARPRFNEADGWVRFYIGINGARCEFHSDSQAFIGAVEPRRIRLDAGSGFFLLPPTEGGYNASTPEPPICVGQMGYRALTIVSRGPADVSIIDNVDATTEESAIMEPGDTLTLRVNDYQGARSLSIGADQGGPCILDMVRIQ